MHYPTRSPHSHPVRLKAVDLWKVAERGQRFLPPSASAISSCSRLRILSSSS